MDDQEYDRLTAEAASIGRNHGAAAGSWVVDGNTDHATLGAIVQASGDGEFFTLIDPVGPLSGEFADGYSTRQLAEDVGYGEDDPAAPEFEDAYLTAYYGAFEAEAVRSATAMA